MVILHFDSVKRPSPLGTEIGNEVGK